MVVYPAREVVSVLRVDVTISPGPAVISDILNVTGSGVTTSRLSSVAFELGLHYW